ncbi:MAG TPA: HAD-IC family P-type ATPase, partial [Patescibacteria group bacterium]|nr:HAD-IC family P-type ATPase [Patescibacteria group bacterium]
MAIVSLGETTPLLWGMWQDIRFGKYGIDILAATSIIASVILGQYWAAIVIVLMLSGGQALEAYAANRSQSELRALLKLAPRSAVVIRKGKEVIVKVENINVGDKIFLKAGEVVPVDSIVVDGQANFDESSLTGESLPQLKEKQSSLMSGSINIDGVITAKAVASAEDSQYQQIIKLVRSAAASQAPFVRLADRYALPFTIAAYSIGIAMWVISGQAIRFLEVIIVATPCPLILAAPIAFISGMAKASRYGIIVKNGQALERLAEAKAIAFDKTGTLTKGELSVKSIRTFYKFKKEEILKYAFSLEQNSNHLLAKAVIEDAKLKGVKPLKVKHLEEIAGLGLVGDIKSDKVQIG